MKATQWKPRKQPRQARSRATVEAVLTAGARILVECGYEKASVNRIAELAGVSVGSLYQYFPTKEALVAAVMKRHGEEMIAVFEKDIGDLARLPLEGAVRGVIARTFQAYAVNPPLQRVLHEQVPDVGVLIRATEFEERLLLVIQAYLEFHREHLRPMNTALSSRLLIHAVEGIARAFVLEDPARLRDPELVEEVAALVLGYVQRVDQNA